MITKYILNKIKLIYIVDRCFDARSWYIEWFTGTVVIIRTSKYKTKT
jgi:hypothetical protein